jgi:hypothetical protein
LKWLSNSIKHAEGYSANQLRQLRPNLFSPPAIRENGMDFFGGKPVSSFALEHFLKWKAPDEIK